MTPETPGRGFDVSDARAPLPGAGREPARAPGPFQPAATGLYPVPGRRPYPAFAPRPEGQPQRSISPPSRDSFPATRARSRRLGPGLSHVRAPPRGSRLARIMRSPSGARTAPIVGHRAGPDQPQPRPFASGREPAKSWARVLPSGPPRSGVPAAPARASTWPARPASTNGTGRRSAGRTARPPRILSEVAAPPPPAFHRGSPKIGGDALRCEPAFAHRSGSNSEAASAAPGPARSRLISGVEETPANAATQRQPDLQTEGQNPIASAPIR